MSLDIKCRLLQDILIFVAVLQFMAEIFIINTLYLLRNKFKDTFGYIVMP